jgi:hypothetical protein
LPEDESGLVTLVPQRADLSDEFSDHVARQSRDPTIADEHCTSRVPHHMTVINDQELDASPPTVHELARTSFAQPTAGFGMCGNQHGGPVRRECFQCVSTALYQLVVKALISQPDEATAAGSGVVTRSTPSTPLRR